MTVTNIADRRARYDDAAERLAAQVEALTDSEHFRRFLHAMSRFHKYSWSNVALILAQMPAASRVNSYKRWQELGRQVRKGERGIWIYAPRLGRDDDGERAVLGFLLVPVFALEQTEGAELPQPPYVEPITGTSLRTQAAETVILDYLTVHGITVSRRDCLPAMGYWEARRREIVIDDTLTGNAGLAVLLHETAHMLAGHAGNVPKADAESVAEAVAHVVMSYLDVDTSGFSVGYIAGWAADADILRQNLSEVRRISHELIDAIEEAQTDDLDLIAA